MSGSSPGKKVHLPPSLSVQVGRPGAPDKEFISIARPDMNLATMNEKFGGVVEFVTEANSGRVIWPARWVHECLPPPARYVVHMEMKEERVPDILENSEYRGETILLISNVPASVTDSQLEAWFRAGLEDEQPDLVNARTGREDLEAKLASIDSQILLLPNTAVSYHELCGPSAQRIAAASWRQVFTSVSLLRSCCNT